MRVLNELLNAKGKMCRELDDTIQKQTKCSSNQNYDKNYTNKHLYLISS
jgi:hypothetical protein